MPNSMSNKPGFYDEGPSAAGGATANKSSDDGGGKDHGSGSKTASKNLNLRLPSSILKSCSFLIFFICLSSSGGSSSSNSGWFGGMWNKLSLKPKNQMILPDDKNPSVRSKMF